MICIKCLKEFKQQHKKDTMCLECVKNVLDKIGERIKEDKEIKNLKFRAYLKKYKMTVDVVRINFDIKTIECYLVDEDEGDFSEFNFDEVELVQDKKVKG